jgi:lysophospholipase L1-like esterase
MEPENKIKLPVILLLGVIIILYAISYINIDSEIAGINLRQIDILSDIKSSQTNEELNLRLTNSDSQISLAGFNNFSIFNFLNGKNDNLINSKLPTPIQGVKVPFVGNTNQLSSFFDALKNSKTKTVRIAHYGDSAIEGDLITADIREQLQSKFGGNGVGWLGIISQDITFRTTTKHSFSDNWESASLYTNNPKRLPLGVSGEIAIPKGKAWVQYEVTRSRRYLKDFSLVKLFYSNAKNSQIYFSFDGGAKQSATLKPGSGIQELQLKPSTKAKLVKIEFPVADQGYFYGITLENESGLYIDNLPLRGNTGVDIGQISPAILKDFAKYLDYKLIILEFGLNIAGSSRTDYSWYEREMVKVVNHLKQAFPKTSIIMISVHDKAMKKGSGFVTDPTILRLLETQKNIAKQADVALWSMFDAMGGENSMPKWVNANPPLAFKDYIHFNDQGAAKIAQLFLDSLMDQFNKYK